MMIQELASPHIEAVNKLVSKAFGYEENASFLNDFPIWGSTIPEVVRLGIYDQQKLVSHVGIRYCEMQTPRGLIPTALIGAVATDEHYRGKGFSTLLLKDALKRIDEMKYEWTLLWGSEHEFYGKLGFQLAGQQTRAAVAKLTIPLGPTPSSRMQTGFTEKIFQALVNERAGIRLVENDRSWVFQHKTIQWMWLNEPFAFIAYERGMDLHHIVHELGGDPSGIHHLLSEVLKRDPEVQVMGRYEALQKLGFNHQAIIQEYLCLARPASSLSKWDSSFWVAGISAC